jgi:hypothetical protein
MHQAFSLPEKAWLREATWEHERCKMLAARGALYLAEDVMATDITCYFSHIGTQPLVGGRQYSRAVKKLSSPA